MRFMRRVGKLLVSVTLAALFLGSGPMNAQRPLSAPRAFSPSSEFLKVTLNELSYDAPALWTSATGTVRSVIAWVGTDPAHHVNVMRSGNGTTYEGKVTLAGISNIHPAVTRASNGAVIVAWTDPARHPVIRYDVYGSAPRQVTLATDYSFTSPALAIFGGKLWLEWAGTDANHSLNMLPLSMPDLTRGAKTVLPAALNANAAPSLTVDSLRQTLLLSWTARSPSNRLGFASSTNGVAWTAPQFLAEWSASGPSMIELPTSFAAYMPGHYVAWTGLDSARSVNVQYTDAYPGWPDPTTTKTTLHESAVGATQVGFIGGPRAILISWTGTDAARHLNVAALTPSSACLPPPGVTSVTPRVISWGNTSLKRVALTFDAGGEDGVRAAQLLTILRNHNLRVTWFMEGQWAQGHPDIVRQLLTDGHEIGNHTVDHPDFVNPARSDNDVCYQLNFDDQIVSDITGVNLATRQTTPPFFRPPYGSYNTQVVNLAGREGYMTVMWSIDPRDWDPATTKQDILNRIFNSPNLKSGAIILLHAGSLHEPEALDAVITGLQQRGFQIVPLSQLIK